MAVEHGHISVCICTYQRPELLKTLLNKLAQQNTNGLFSYSVVVADNDSAQSAKPVVGDFAGRSSLSVTYCVEPEKNIALVRNKALANAKGDFIAFIDDDEVPDPTWLWALFTTCRATGADGVLGPVLPYFEQEPPAWALRGRFFERPTHVTGYRIDASDARTGNVMFRRTILDGPGALFRAKFGSGGEDVDFFWRQMGRGRIFVWCNEAVVYELVPAKRCSRRYLLRRALLQGNNGFKYPADRVLNVFKAFCALPVYGLMLPCLLVAGDHHFLTVMIKFCDHLGRFLALFHLALYPKREL
jgi:succinoglycan biosynthesis protein ExoM